MTSEDRVLEVESITKAYRRRPVLRAVTLRVSRGEAVAVVGPNGAGKSTFLGCVTGDRLPDSGSIRICGHDPFSDHSATAACMGSVPENPFLYGELTIAETIRFVSEVRGLNRDRSGMEAARLLGRFGLAGAEGVLCRELSQGMGRKAAIVLALLHTPDVLVLDEVFNGLDQPSTKSLVQELSAHRARGGAVLLSSHDLPLLAEHCDRGLLLAPDGWSLLDGEAWQRWREVPALTLS
ncbi:MAG: ABC transporter ATP-binding protein [Gemmatimonadota bacterium]